MSRIPLEAKLQLVEQVRSQYQKNQTDLNRREQILYGRSFHHVYDTSYDFFPTQDVQRKPDTEEMTAFSSRIRLLAAVGLVTLVITCDQKRISFWGIDTQKIFHTLSYDRSQVISSALEDWLTKNLSPIDWPVP